MLTAKQEAFARCIVEGMSQSDAYRSAYNTSRMTDKSIWEKASELANDVKVAERIKELRDKIASKSIMTAQERLEWLSTFVNTGAMYTLSTDKLRAIDIMNKMQGEYTQKIEANVTSEVNINVELVDE